MPSGPGAGVATGATAGLVVGLVAEWGTGRAAGGGFAGGTGR